MTEAELRGQLVRAHAARLRDLVAQARSEFVEAGSPVPDRMWAKLDEAEAALAASLPSDHATRSRRGGA